MIEALTRAGEVISPCVDASMWALPEPDLLACLDAVHVLEQRLAAVKLALVREVDGRAVAGGHGASSTAVWLRDRLRIGGPSARRMLVDSAGQFEPQMLRRLGERILSHVAPDLAEQAELAALSAAEARAHDRRYVTLSSEQADGQVRVTGRLDVESAAIIRAAIDPLCAPAAVGDDRSPGQRRADALTEVCRLALNTEQLPDNGGDRPQIVVTVDLDTITRQLATGTLDTGQALSPEMVRRLACDAAILPAVLDGAGQVLDLGRQRRLFTGPLRRALVLRDRGCAFPGCDRPPRWTDGHHITHWTDGGETNLTNAVLLCRYHHRVIHHSGWQVRLAADGIPEFLPPAWLDPAQHPRRNHYHQRC